ncbi:hypothetical protein HYE82_12335 [Streptomyces sp. BR123]|uniref:hypothetical protein n=1 Tax=Streptomyces sp. BR123 TaxID=2749828 RepID=UPI0015C428CE|nr:hypothetical protein [Streptomyces sp. BR123]NXY95166.1 hypothetical protein [Streptomyces sp. BR123]
MTAASLARAEVEPRLLAGFEGEPMAGGGRPTGGIRPVAAPDPPTTVADATARPQPLHHLTHPPQE